VRFLPSKAQLERLAQGAITHVPVWGEILCDRDTPVSAFAKLHRGPFGCLLESNEGGEQWGRYSFVVTEPAAVIEARGRDVSIRHEGGRVEELRGDPLSALREVLGRYRVAAVPGLPRFTGGLVGYVAYDAVRWIERLESPPPDDLGLPDLLLFLVDTLAIFDNQTQKMMILTHADVGAAASTGAAFATARARIEALAARLDEPARPLRVRADEPVAGKVSSNLSPEAYQAAVGTAKEYIAAGDVIQVVLAQRFERPFAASAFDLYRCLRSINPSPYL
jgi:anthranilate synthase component 1